MNEPLYRIRIEIYDDECGEIISKSDQPLLSSEEDNVSEMYRVLRDFKKRQEEHEETYYPKQDSEE